VRQSKRYSQVVIAGFGDIGRRVSCLLPPETDLLTLSRSTLDKTTSDTLNHHKLDLDAKSIKLPPIQTGALIFYFIPPPANRELDLRAGKFLSAMEDEKIRPSRIVAISTSGVYGDRKGGCVSEDDVPNPQTDRARRRLDMECQFKLWCTEQKTSLIILRVGGIYGPGRLPINQIKNDVPVLHEHLAPRTNRIHAGDLAKICIASSLVEHDFRIYNVSDGQDSNMTEYFNTIADYFDLPRPPQVDWDEIEQRPGSNMISYLRESRHLITSRMHAELDIELEYPNLLTGLTSCKLK
jgi:hypothetical protein